MKTLTKKIILSALVTLLSACAYHQNGYGTYSGNDPYSSNGYYSGSNYPSPNYPGYGGFQPYPGYGNYPSYPSYQYPSRGYRGPYNAPQSNNNYYYNNNNYNRYPPQPRQPSYQNPRYGYQGDRRHDDDDVDHRRSTWGGLQNQNGQQARPQPDYGYNQNRPRSPQADSVMRPHGEWPRNQSNGMMQHPNHQGGGWQGQSRQQPHVEHNNEHSNFGTISEQMGQKPVQQGYHGQNNHKKYGQQND